jgi:uncharacterized membrane protein
MNKRRSSIGTIRSASLPTIFALTVCMLAAGQALFHDDSFAATNLTISPPTVSLPLTVGQANTSITLSVKNTGTATASFLWTDTMPELTTLNTTTNPINLTAGQTFQWRVTVVPPATAGSYTGSITIASGGQSTLVPVTLTVTGGDTTPAIGLSPTSLAFTGIAGGTNPAAKTIGISNSGSGTLTWSAGDNAAWLTLSPTSGTNIGTVNANVNLAGLAAGTYNATVTMTASGVTAKTLPVTLTLTATTGGAMIGFSPTSLTFTGTAGSTNPAAKTISISNSGSGTLSWATSDNAAWLILSPVSGTNSGTITASVNLTGLATGTYNATITVTATGSTNSPQQIPVSLMLSTISSGTTTLTWNANAESDLTGYKVYRGTASGAYGAPVATLPKTATSYIATGLQTGTTYFFVITAYDSAGNESTLSNEVSKSIF